MGNTTHVPSVCDPLN